MSAIVTVFMAKPKMTATTRKNGQFTKGNPGGPGRPRKEVVAVSGKQVDIATLPKPFAIEPGDTVEEIMSTTAPGFLQWAFERARTAAMVGNDPFGEKIALLLIHKTAPAASREPDKDKLPAGATKKETKLLKRLMQELSPEAEYCEVHPNTPDMDLRGPDSSRAMTRDVRREDEE